MDFTFQDDPEDKKPGITFKTEAYKEPPKDEYAVPRAAKFAWATDKPQVDVLAQIQNGGENELRSQLATREDATLKEAQLAVLEGLAKNGANPDEEGWKIIQDLTLQDFKNDPQSILEKKFSDKYMREVFSTQNKFLGKNFNPVSTPEAAVGAHLVEQGQYYQHQLEDLETEASNRGFFSKAADLVGQAIPFLPWYRQRAALNRPGIEFLPGTSMEQNILFMRQQPFEQQKVLYKQAIDYLKSKNYEDALTFARGMHSFSSSDFFLANSMGLADWTSLGSVAGKAAIKLSGLGAKIATKADPLAIVKATEHQGQSFGDYLLGQDLEKIFEGPIQASPWVHPAERARLRPTDQSRQLDLFGTPEQGSFRFMNDAPIQRGVSTPEQLSKPNTFNLEPRQLDLFGEQPDQGSLRFMTQPGQNTPPGEASLPGRFRATHEPYAGRAGSGEGTKSLQGPYRDVLGRQRRKSEQLDMNFGPKAGEQLNLPFSRQTPPGGPQSAVLRGPTASKEAEQLSLGLNTPSQQPRFPEPYRTIGDKAFKEPPLPDISELKRAIIGAVKGASEPTLSPATALAHVGDVRTSGLLGALERISNKGRGIYELAKEVPTFANPAGFLRDSGVISRERAQALAPQLVSHASGLVDKFINVQRVARMTPEAEAEAYRLAEDALSKEYGGRVQAALLDTRYTPKEIMEFLPGKDKATNTNYLTLVLGKPDKTLFKSRDEANLYKNDIYKLGSEAEPVQHGNGYKLEINKALDETADTVRDGMVVPNNRANSGMVNMLVGSLRSAADHVSPFQRGNRSIATHSPQEIQATIQGEIKRDIQSLPKESRRAVEDILRENRDTWNPETKQKGAWYNTAAQFEQAFLARHKRLPNEQEIIAYDTYKRLSDFDYIMRNTTVYRDKARLGVEQFQFAFNGGKSPWFEGKSLDAFPWKLGRAGENDHDAGIWIYNSNTGAGKFHYKFDVDPAARKEIDALISDEGYRVVQVFDAKQHPLAGIAKTADGSPLKDQVHYIITNTWDKKAMAAHQVEYNPGVHVIYKNDWYVAQPVIQAGRLGKDTYLGDNVALNVTTRAEALKWASRMNEGRLLIKSGKDDQLAAFLSKNLPYTEDEFRNLFRRSDSPFSVDHPITIKEKNKNTFESNPGLKERYSNVVDGTKSPYDMSNWMDKSFLADRDHTLPTIKEGPDGVMTLREAEQLDPYIALQKAFGQELRNVWMNDYKIQAIESWLREFAGTGVFRPSEHTLVSHPTFFLYNMEFNQKADKALLAAAKAQQKAIVNFIGSRSELGGSVEYIKQKLMDGVYNKTGRSINLSTADPVSFLRGIAFHEKLGLFNPVQLLVQMQSVVHSLALSPRSWVQGVSGGQLARYLAHNPAQAETLAGVAEKMGWKREHFLEMTEAMRNSGVMQVAGEAALRDDVFDPKLFKSTFMTWLDKGAFFFTEGERMVRLTSFATAYHEWRMANQSRKLTDQAMGHIMDRYRTMSVDMTRDANAAWQAGVMSVPTQFFAFNARLAEQLIGGRLTGAEKFRAFSVYSALYGIPVAGGSATLGVSPLGWAGVPSTYEDIKAYAYERGININEGFLKGATEGLLSLGVSWLTGRDYNVASRFGPGASTAVSNWFKQDTSLAEIAFGASGSILADTIKAMHPFAYYAAHVFGGTQNEYPVVANDWLDIARNASVVDTATKAFGALNYGKWYTKSGTSVGPADSLDAYMAFAGLTRQDLSDTYLKMAAIKDVETMQKPYANEALKNWRLGLQAGASGDYKLMDAYFTRAHTNLEAGDFTNEQRQKLFKQGMAQGRDLSEKINWDLVRKGRASSYNKRLDNYGK